MSTSSRPIGHVSDQLFLKPWVGIVFVLCLSFLFKVVLRLFLSQNINFWESGYSFYYKMALNFLQTGELYLQNGHGLYFAEKLYAIRMPLYPFLIAIIGKLTNFSVVAFVVIQALISTLTAAVVYKIAARFNSKAAFLSALLYAFYPYSLFHDTQLQENVVYNFLSLISVWCLLISAEQRKNLFSLMAGLALGACVLTRASHLIHTFFLIVLLLYRLKRNVKKALVCTSLVLLGFLLTLGPWIIRNKRAVGSFVLTSLTGGALAEAHNEFTFLYFPYKGSIDKSTKHFKSSLLETRGEEMKNPRGDEMAQSKWYQQMAIEYILSHKVQTMARGFYKAAVNFLGLLSPQQNFLKNWAYSLSYWILTLFMIKSFPTLKKTFFLQIFVTLCFSQAIFSFIFWAHSSHRSFLDPMLAITAGIGLTLMLNPREPMGTGKNEI